MMKYMLLKVEWDGAADESAYASVVSALVEENDTSKITRVTVLDLSRIGATEPRVLPVDVERDAAVPGPGL